MSKIFINTISVVNIYFDCSKQDNFEKNINDLNISFNNINSYLKAERKEEAETELIKSLSYLKVINEHTSSFQLYQLNQLYGYWQQNYNNRHEFNLIEKLFKSVITLLELKIGHITTKKDLFELAKELFFRLYPYHIFPLENILYTSMRHKWLKTKKLLGVSDTKTMRGLPQDWGYIDNNNKSMKVYIDLKSVEFFPSQKEIDDFFNKNQQHIYEYMVRHLNKDETSFDPMECQSVRAFYKNYIELANLEPKEMKNVNLL